MIGNAHRTPFKSIRTLQNPIYVSEDVLRTIGDSGASNEVLDKKVRRSAKSNNRNDVSPVCGTKLIKKRLPQKKEHISLVFGTKSEPGRIEIILPIRTISEANCFEPWRNKHKRHKAQKRAVMFAMLPIKQFITTDKCTLRFIRYAPGTLNAHDNLRMALKYIVDQTCAEIMNDFRPGRADDGDNFTFEYDQVKSKEYAVKIEILF
jgi:hypothetical protein